MQKYIGSDVTSMVTLPVIIFEPMTMLQKMAEVCAHYNNILMFCLLSDAHDNISWALFLTVDGILASIGHG